MKTELRHGFYALAFVCVASVSALPAKAAFLAGTTVLAPGTTVVPSAVSFNTDAGSFLDSSIVNNPLFGTSVFRNPSGTIDFYYSVGNTADFSVGVTMTAMNFDTFATAVGFLFRFPQDIPPLAASRSTDGSVVIFTFSLPPHSQSQPVIISTNATTFSRGNVSVTVDGDTLGPFHAFQPGAQSVPDNGTTMSLFGFALSGLATLKLTGQKFRVTFPNAGTFP
jgi:VPDSG-CTERM motif